VLPRASAIAALVVRELDALADHHGQEARLEPFAALTEHGGLGGVGDVKRLAYTSTRSAVGRFRIAGSTGSRQCWTLRCTPSPTRVLHFATRLRDDSWARQLTSMVKHFLLVSVLAAILGTMRDGRAEPLRASDAFGSGKHALSLTTGWGFGHELSGSEKDALDTRTIPVLFRWSMGVTDALGGDAPYRGNMDVGIEGTFLLNYEPEAGGAQGGSAFLRYNFLSSERFVPYVGLGLGLVNLDYDLETQRDGFNFAIAGEVGVHALVTDRVAITGGYRLQHISNARTARPNLGVETSFATIGLTYFVR
jgi:opacity protein-like surface antigen